MYAVGKSASNNRIHRQQFKRKKSEVDRKRKYGVMTIEFGHLKKLMMTRQQGRSPGRLRLLETNTACSPFLWDRNWELFSEEISGQEGLVKHPHRHRLSSDDGPGNLRLDYHMKAAAIGKYIVSRDVRTLRGSRYRCRSENEDNARTTLVSAVFDMGHRNSIMDAIPWRIGEHSKALRGWKSKKSLSVTATLTIHDDCQYVGMFFGTRGEVRHYVDSGGIAITRKD
ncbi:hypothetical protein SERLA73DRAFT_152590 [Serpula lacrymans var. lacrymans S7.3]|uniref:Uncharacterized protein n=1 Tax=Serpula lacrymans var. lacrymans (strain S7.3) TaxID=936435 RepID=F8PY01_SERL3|nr:hypothetical protein SERLA73DRAFT_152590 [Serpula lacrymans var. lacrymans S7.3]